MNTEKLSKIVDDHGKWLRAEDGGSRADLSGADLIRADLSGADLIRANLIRADLIRANLSGANLRDADLRDADLRGADLIRANLIRADLSGADLIRANLSGADLSGADLRDADLRGADLIRANLIRANLRGADLIQADLSGADLRDADLSGAAGLNTARAFFAQLERDEIGYIVYKRIGTGKTTFAMPLSWKIEPGAFLEEVVNPCPVDDCACGVNFGTLEWCKSNYTNAALWKCRIRFEDMADVVVPYASDGKARCGRLELIEIVK